MALGKLFRTTVFKISLAYLAISAIGAGLVLGAVGWNMERLIDEPDLAAGLGAAARGRVTERFSVPLCADSHLRLWSDILGSGR